MNTVKMERLGSLCATIQLGHPILCMTNTILDISSYLLIARFIVPHVSAISSTRTATFPLTSPTNTMLATSLAFFLYRKHKKAVRARGKEE